MNDVANRFLPTITVKNNIIVDCNHVLTELLETTPSDILDTPLQNIFSLANENGQRIAQLIPNATTSGHDEPLFANLKNKYCYELLTKVHYQFDGIDSDSYKVYFQVVKNKATDAITELPNGWAIFSQATQLLNTPNIVQNNFVLLIVSADNFSTINFRYGYDAGDAYLFAFGKKLTRVAKDHGLVARFSNAKFGILVTNQYQLSEQAFKSQIIQLCEDICALSDTPLQLNNEITICKPCSIGVSNESRLYEDFHGMEIAAETAMAQAKKYSTSKYFVATSQSTNDFIARKLIIDELPTAIEQNQINIHYQPQYDLRNGDLTGFEALSRWQHEVLGNIPPDTFISIAEDIAIHFEFDLWVLTQVCSQIVTWQQQGIDTPRIAINVSFKTLEMTTFIPRLNDILHKTQCPVSLIELEITETSSAKNLQPLHENILQIKQLDISIAVDDFGSGYSSLSLIRRFHLSLDTLKIDRTLIENICNTDVDREFARKIIELSKVLNVKILAEGIENIDQYKLLKELGCDSGQGYYFDRPLTKQQAEQLMSKK